MIEIEWSRCQEACRHNKLRLLKEVKSEFSPLSMMTEKELGLSPLEINSDSVAAQKKTVMD